MIGHRDVKPENVIGWAARRRAEAAAFKVPR